MDIEFGQLFRYMTAEPYYIWKLRLQGQEQWKDVVFKDEGYLLDQKNFAKMCIRYLNKAPYQVSNNDWNQTLNTILPNLIEVEVKQESDTSGLSIVRNAFILYLANKQTRRDTPYQVRGGLCYRKVENGKAKFFFTAQGFTKYLQNQKVNFDMALMRETLKQFGAIEDILVYTNSFGEEMRFPCWSKEEDESINEAYIGTMEIENGDKANMGIVGVSEADNVLVPESNSDEKPYSDEDLKNAQELF